MSRCEAHDTDLATACSGMSQLPPSMMEDSKAVNTFFVAVSLLKAKKLLLCQKDDQFLSSAPL